MIDLPSLEDEIALLTTAAKDAGKIALSYFKKNPKVWLKEENSPVTEADLAVDAYLKEKLLTARPDYGWISEETEDTRPDKIAGKIHQRSFIVDPIDGTRGFIEGRQEWCISIAIIEDGRPIAGVLQCPVLEETYCATHHGGATLNGTLLHCSTRNKPESWVISAKDSYMKKIKDAFSHKVIFYHSVPSLAYRLACVATGKIDIVVVRPKCHDWDIAAADLILKEAGGALLTNTDRFVRYGKPPYQQSLLLGIQMLARKDMFNIVHTFKLG